MGILDDLLGNEQLQKQYKDFVKRYEQGDPSEGYSDQEVLKRHTPCRPTSTLRRRKRR